MNNVFLSCQFSAVENARRLAEYGQATESLTAIHKEIIDFPLKEVRVSCVAAVVGLVALGILIACTLSGVMGGVVILSTLIPIGIIHKYAAKKERLVARFTSESENELKVIYQQISVLFIDAIEKKSANLANEWNNGQVRVLSSELDEEKVKEKVLENFNEILQTHEKKSVFNLQHENKSIQVSYIDLKRYASAIAKILPKQPDSTIFESILHPKTWVHELQGICEIFNKKCLPNMTAKVVEKDALKDLKDSKTTEARKFCYTEVDTFDNTKTEKVMICFLKKFMPESSI